MVKEIPLGGKLGGVALIDEEDWELVNHGKWHNCRGYAIRYQWINGKKTRFAMHRVITNAPIGVEVDHINSNGIDNRKSNLRLCTRQQNGMNQSPQKRETSSKYKGVAICKRSGQWQVHIKHKQKQISLGRYRDEVEAAKAYDRKAEELFGEYAKLNFPK